MWWILWFALNSPILKEGSIDHILGESSLMEMSTTACTSGQEDGVQHVRADFENPATTESSRTQVLPGLILQFGWFQLNVKQLWPFICSSPWNPSEGKLSPISSSLPTPSMQLCFLKTEGSKDSQLAELHQKKKKKLPFLSQGKAMSYWFSH